MPLALRRGTVASVNRDGPEIELTVDLGSERRPAIAHRSLTGEMAPGDDVVVNVAALDLGLGSGGVDIVHVNLTRGLDAPAKARAAVKLNYTSLQHTVAAVESTAGSAAGAANGPLAGAPLDRPVAVLALHGQLEPVAWAAAQARPGARLGFIQTEGGALAGQRSRAVRELRRRGLLCEHLTAGPAFGGEAEAVTVAGAIHAALTDHGWDAAIVGPGPGIVGSSSALGHGGLAALDSAHAALALGARVVLVPRLSDADPRPRHQGLSHHTATVLDLLLHPVDVALPRELADRPTSLARHRVRETQTEADLDGYQAAGLSARTMGRSIDEDALFFRAALAGGRALAEEVAGV
jgi:hypothetical protein